MTLTLVPRATAAARMPRLGPWVKISLSLMACGILALTTATVIGVRWYYGMHQLVPNSVSSAVTVPVGQPYVIDELVTNTGGSPILDLRGVSARVGANTAGATVIVRTCGGSASVTACDEPAPLRAGPIDLTAQRIVVIVRSTKAGTVQVNGVGVSYRAGVRSATQDVGPSVTISFR